MISVLIDGLLRDTTDAMMTDLPVVLTGANEVIGSLLRL